MRSHVFVVWDFQSLLKALQREVTCVQVPWLPTTDPEARRFVNEIVLDEESDEAPGGGFVSHFELYLQAMQDCGADTRPIRGFLGDLRQGRQVGEALARPDVPLGVASFVRHTMAVAASCQPHRIAAAFAYGREEVIPAMFRRLVDRLADIAPQRWSTFRYYLERHIGQDRRTTHTPVESSGGAPLRHQCHALGRGRRYGAGCTGSKAWTLGRHFAAGACGTTKARRVL